MSEENNDMEQIVIDNALEEERMKIDNKFENMFYEFENQDENNPLRFNTLLHNICIELDRINLKAK